MNMSFIRFESARKKEQIRSELRDAREDLLEKAKRSAERQSERKTAAFLKGETNWMLPSVTKKFVESKQKKLKKSKKTKKSKSSTHKSRKRKRRSSSSDSEDISNNHEEKRHKKSKKTKKSHQKEYSSSSSSSSDDDSSNKTKLNEDWVEKPNEEPKLVRDNWMMDSTAFGLKTFSKERKEPKQDESKEIQKYDPKTSTRELNPYWRTGTGTGLPAFQKPKDHNEDEEKTSHQSILSHSGNWRKKSAIIEDRTEKKSNALNSSSGSESDDESETNASAGEFLTDQQMNELGAKIVKAEILGNVDLANELKAKLEKARAQRSTIKKSNLTKTSKKSNQVREEHILLTHTDKMGNSRPLQHHKNDGFDSRDLYGGRSGRKKSKKSVETHLDGERVRYFPDDDKYDIKQMFEREKYTSASESNLQFANIASKHKNKNDDLDDIFADKVRRNISDTDSNKKDMDRAIRSQEKLAMQLENCDKCFDSKKMNKSLIVSMGEKVYLALPWHIGLQNGHCLIVPTQHASCSTQLDEDTWEEIENFRKALTRMFAAQKKDVIFFEIANKLHRQNHLSIHCIPIPMNQSEMAPFYFKKAIEESEHEWSVNKQLVTLKPGKGLRSSIPKGLPYFYVQFSDIGFAHVIEDESRFPSNFALEIIGGMLQLEPSKWRKLQKEQNTISKVKLFADNWKHFDCTK